MAYSYHIGLVKEIARKDASRISALLDIMLNDDNGSANLGCAKCKWRVESLEMAMMNLTKFKSAAI